MHETYLMKRLLGIVLVAFVVIIVFVLVYRLP